MSSLALGLALALVSNEPPPPSLEPEPRRGRVALGLGIAGMVAGAPMVLTGFVFLLAGGKPVEGEKPSPVGPIVLGTGIGTVALGTTGVIVGSLLNRKWNAWKARNPGRVSRLELAPIVWAGRESFAFLVAGRF